MTKTIWKFTLEPSRYVDVLCVKMPRGAKILCAGSQFENICIWAEVDPDASREDRCFEFFGTGHPIKYDMGQDRKYLGSAMMRGGSLVFHIYERFGV